MNNAFAAAGQSVFSLRLVQVHLFLKDAVRTSFSNMSFKDKHTGRVQLARLVIAAITLSFAIWVVYRHRDSLATLQLLRLKHVLTLILIYLAYFVSSVVPYLALIRHLSSRSLPFLSWLRIMFISRFANSLAPQAGTAYKAVVLKKQFGVSYTTYLHVYTLFAWITTTLNLLLAGFLSTGLLIHGTTQEQLLSFTLLALGFLALIAPFVARFLFSFWQPKQRWLSAVRDGAHNLLTAMTEHGTHPRLLAIVIGLGLLRFGFWILFFRVALSGFGVEVSLAALAVFLAIWNLSALIVITPGNLGVQEVVYGIVGSAVGIGAAHGVMLSALIRAIQYMVVFPLGIACGGWGMLKRQKTESRKLA